MRKIVLILLILLMTGCSSKKVDVEVDNNVIENGSSTDDEEIYVDDNPIKLGLYLYDGTYNQKEIIDKEHYTDFISGKDIDSFEVFLTDERMVSGTSFKDIWNKYYNSYTNIQNYKVGFNIKFILSDGTNFNANFLEPDIFKFSNYFYVYLYDDVNQKDGVMYSHLEEVNDNTIMTSIKIFAVDGIDEVENIILTAFTYDGEEDFDSDGNYRGNSSYTIRIKRK